MFSWIVIFLNLISMVQDGNVKETDQWVCRELLVRAEKILDNTVVSLKKGGKKVTYNIKKHFCSSEHLGALLSEMRVVHIVDGKKFCKYELYFSVYREDPVKNTGKVVHWLLENRLYDCPKKSR